MFNNKLIKLLMFRMIGGYIQIDCYAIRIGLTIRC